MARFRYRMQNILNLKEKLESQEKMAFAAATMQVAEEEAKLSELLARQGEYERRLKELTESAIDVREISHCKRAITTMKTYVRDQMFALQRAQANLAAVNRRLSEATKERKTQEKLREKAFEQFKQDLLKEESKATDELVSFTYGVGGK